MESPKQESTEARLSDAAAPTQQEVAEKKDGFVARYWPYARPYLQQTWLNIKVWIPVLLNPGDRAREVRYWTREAKHRDTWELALPKQCWDCGSTENLRKREWRLELHSFEYPTLIVGIALGTAIPALWLASKWMTAFFLTVAFVALVGGIVAIYLKCWPEQVRIIMSTCEEHADTMPSPEVVVDQGELYLFAPTAQLAEAAREELKKRRREMKRVMPDKPGAGRDESAVAMEDTPRREAPAEPPPKPARVQRTPAPDLPPIKLAGEEDDESSPKTES